MSTSSNITPMHKLIFRALTAGPCDDFAMLSCLVNGEDAVAIIAIEQQETSISVMPLFVTLTPSMILTGHEGETIWDGSGGGGGPRHEVEPERAFAVSKASFAMRVGDPK
jgi:hypothetical protein